MPGFPEHMRVFTAVELDEEIRSRIDRQRRRLLDGVGRVGSVPKGNLHVTLKFVGDIHRDDLPALSKAVADGAARLREGVIRLQGVGAFPRLSRPRVIWAGVSDPEDILGPVFRRLDENLAEFGAMRERKRFVPHVTLARVRGPIDTDLFEERLEERPGEGGEFAFGRQTVEAVTLFMSELQRGRPPRYTPLGHYEAGT